ncbi:1150_t:CDS:1 [Paraglomus occultum]|uniref:1150_t:CDS:1 n=1 Tax=Paraglomus occultum TaxID=144539 RepID=A0A9N9DHM1_9GLOM|nr:1150_t:CDS:1 [Paraglomus occultum]
MDELEIILPQEADIPTSENEEINILLLGETGVGKSTFINAFVNYLKFDTLYDAKNEELEVLITSKFTVTDENYEMKSIKIGDNDPNELADDKGTSSTQGCIDYEFAMGNNALVRLIDTPGIGDTRGIDKDKENFENILKYIARYKHLNGICIFLKPNSARLTVVFRFCIQELLSHLHRSAKDNIVFCFTNSRTTFYRPGETLVPLREQLDELRKRSGIEIKIDRDTMYCFDNEAFRFLAAIRGGIKFNDDDEKSFAESWRISAEESSRLIQHVRSRQRHEVQDTLSLNNARNMVVELSKPLAGIEQVIQINLSLIKSQQDDIKNCSKNIEDLKKDLYIPQVDLEAEELQYPQTVCTSQSCVDVLTTGEDKVKKFHYKTQCHSRCYLTNVTCNVVNNEALRHCSAMGPKGTCQHCGCLWNAHMHITYDLKVVEKKVVDPNIEMRISKTKSFQETKAALLADKQNRTELLRKEQHTINSINIQFAKFLRQSAIAPFNDAYADYLDHFINQEKIKKADDLFNYNNEILDGLEDTKRVYLTKIESIKKAIENGDSSEQSISPEDIERLAQQLYSLELTGNTLKKINDIVVSSQASAFFNERNNSSMRRKRMFFAKRARGNRYLPQKIYQALSSIWK